MSGWYELIGPESPESTRSYAIKLLKNGIIRPTKKTKLGMSISPEEDVATDSGIALVVSRAQMVIEPLTKTIGLKVCLKLGIHLEDDEISSFIMDSASAAKRGGLLEDIIYLRYIQFGVAPLMLLPGWPKDISLEGITPPNIIIQNKHLEGGAEEYEHCAIKPHDEAGPDLLHIPGKSPVQSVIMSFKIRQAERGFDPCVKKEECEKAVRTTDPNKFYHEKKG